MLVAEDSADVGVQPIGKVGEEEGFAPFVLKIR